MDNQIVNQNNQLESISQPNNIKFEYTTKQIAEGFECDEGSIRSAKSRYESEFIKGIDWDMAAVADATGAKHTTIWSKEGIIKLASKLKLTEKAFEFILAIRLEEEKKKLLSTPNFNNPAEAARAWANEYEAKQKALLQLEEQKPKVELANSIIGHKGNFSVKEFIDNFKFDIGRNKFLELLRSDKVLMSYPNKNHPYQQYAKYFKIERTVKNEKSVEKVLITPEGYVFLSRKYANLMQQNGYQNNDIATYLEEN
jgi:phage antirepressor YoqD-like protein